MKAVYWLLIPLVLIAASAHSLAAESIGLVVGLQGNAHAMAPGGAERALALKSPIYMKDTITTEPGAKLQVMFNDDSLYSQGEKSAVVIDEYVYNPAKKEDNSFLMRIIRGVSRIVTGGIADLNPDRFTVKTSRATIGIRGCELGFEVYDDFEKILIIRVPIGRLIEVLTEGAAEPYRYRQPTWLQIGPQGVTERDLTAEDVKGLSISTTPTAGPDSGTGDAGGSSSDTSGGATTDSSVEPSSEPAGGSADSSSDGSTEIGDTTTSGSPVSTDPVTTADALRQDVIPNTTDSTAPVTPPPPPPPGPSGQVVKGGDWARDTYWTAPPTAAPT